MRHLNMKFHFVREKILSGDVQPTYVKSGDNIADSMTKSVRGKSFDSHISQMGMVDMRECQSKSDQIKSDFA